MSLLGDLGTAIKNKLGGTSVDNTVPRYNGTTCTLQGSGVTISDTNVVTASGGFVGNLTGNAETVTNGVYTTGDQTIAGVKTFSSSPIVPDATTITQAVNKGQLDTKQNTLISGTNIKTINSTSLLGSGNISITETAWVANDSRAKTALNANGTAPIYACRAWVNFNGTGTVAIRASGNVSSITDNGVGNYTVNFTTPIIDDSFTLSSSLNIRAYGANALIEIARTASSINFTTSVYSAGAPNTDASIITISIHR